MRLKIILINKANNKKTKQINQHKNDDFNTIMYNININSKS